MGLERYDLTGLLSTGLLYSTVFPLRFHPLGWRLRHGGLTKTSREAMLAEDLIRQDFKADRPFQILSGVGSCYDNARMESFYATLKKELLYRISFGAVFLEIFFWIRPVCSAAQLSSAR